MKVTKIGSKEVNLEIGYVWDKEDKYLVIIDNYNKIKYAPDTLWGIIDEDTCLELLEKYAISILGMKDSCIEFIVSKFKPRRICHNDDFYYNYKKKFQLVSPKECREIGLKY